MCKSQGAHKFHIPIKKLSRYTSKPGNLNCIEQTIPIDNTLTIRINIYIN